jgi:hypothetical protein
MHNMILDFFEEQKMARETLTHVDKFVHRFTIIKCLTLSAISTCFNSNFIGIRRQKVSELSVT